MKYMEQAKICFVKRSLLMFLLFLNVMDFYSNYLEPRLTMLIFYSFTDSSFKRAVWALF